MYQSRPVYIGVPTDIVRHNPQALYMEEKGSRRMQVFKMISSSGLKTPLKTSLPANDPAEEQKVVTEIINRMESHANPVIIVDGGKIKAR